MSNQKGHPGSGPEPENQSQDTAEQEPEQDAVQEALREALPKAAGHSGTGTIKVSG